MIYTHFNTLKSKQGKQKETTWTDFCNLVRNIPSYPSKQQQPLIKLATFENDSRASGTVPIHIYGIELDYDDGRVTPEQAANRLQSVGIQAIVCTTYTHKPDFPKWRAFLPLSKPYKAKHREALVSACDEALGHIIAPESYRSKQCFFIGKSPNIPYTVIESKGKPLDTLPLIQQAARDYLKAKGQTVTASTSTQQKVREQKVNTQAQKQEQHRSKAEKLLDEQLSIIDTFNEHYSIKALLLKHGYQENNERYIAPNSTSGIAGVVLLNDTDGKERCYSHHSSDALANEKANDAFEVFTLLEHNGDTLEAIKAASRLLYTPSGNSLYNHNRRIWQLRNITQALNSIPNNNMKVAVKVGRSLATFNNGFDIWAAWYGTKATPQIWQQISQLKPYKPETLLMLAKEVTV